MKKSLFIAIIIILYHQYGKGITVIMTQPGSLNTLISNRSITNLTISGTIDARDFKFMRDSMPNLSTVDLQNSNIASYNGIGGTSEMTSDTYASDIVPAFAFCDPVTTTGKPSLNSITFPKTLKGIDYEAFEGCSNLHQQLIIPDGVTFIGDMSFYLCSGLTGVLNIPATCTTLGFHAFEGASNITEINITPFTTDITAGCIDITPMKVNVDPTNPSYVANNDFLFTKDMTLLMHGPSYLTGKYIVPSTVTAIAFHCFEKCQTMGEIVFPPNLKHIGSGAFYYCSDMTQELKFPETLEMISDQAFEGCENINGNLAFPKSQISIGNSAFKGCTGINGTLTFNDSLGAIGNSAFEGCSGIKGQVVIPPLIKKIGNSTFKNCKGITEVSIPNSVSTIGSDAFNGCNGLLSIKEERNTPVSLSNTVFKNVNQSNTTLFVPDGSKSLYKNTPVWKDFKYIIEGKGFRPVDSVIYVGKTAGSNGTTNIVSNTTWTATSNAHWITVSPTSPTNGSGPLIVTSLTKNPYTKPRIATITITTTEGVTQDITITQEAGDPTLDVSSKTSMVAKEAGAKSNITVFSNTTWTAISDQPWLTVNPASGTDDGILTFTTTQANPNFATRSANVTISASGVAPITVVVTQSDKITLMFTPEPIVTTSKPYDKKKDAKIILGVMSGVDPLFPDVNVTASASYSDANTGTGKKITISYIISGNDASKYFCPTDYSAIGEITPIDITITAQSDNKTYDGNNASSKSPVMTGSLIGSDSIVKMAKQNFDNKNAGTNKTILVGGLVIEDGNGGNNYNIKYVSNTSGLISPVLITIKAQSDVKTYDGTTNSIVTPLQTGNVIAPDIIDSLPRQYFDNRKVGVNKTITPKGMVIKDGNGGNNYQIIYTSTNTGTIKKADVLIILTTSTRADDKEYDGTTKVTISNATLNGIISGDDVTLDTIVGGFAQAKPGNDIAVNISLSLKGVDAFNYTLKQPSGLSANILPKKLTVVNTIGIDKKYDGNSNATIQNATLTGIVGSEDVILTNTTSASFKQSNAGKNIPINTAFGLIGKDVGNYLLLQPSDVSATILSLQTSTSVPSSLTLSKVYDATTTASITPSMLSDVLSFDMANVSLIGSANYDNINVGSSKTITVSYTLTGSASNNYLPPLDYVSYQGTITPKTLTIKGTKVENIKMYDGTNSTKIIDKGTLEGVYPLDSLSISLTATANFDDEKIGINKAITVQYQLNGTSSPNYTVPSNMMFNDGKILEHLKLNPLDTISDGCEGSEINIAYSIVSGEASKYRITFDTNATNEGLKNIDYTPLPDKTNKGVLSFIIPNNFKSGTYLGTLQLANEYGGESPAYDFEFTIGLSSSLIVSKFDDIVICDNSSKSFTNYQWYHNNQIIPGATLQFYYDANGLVGTYSLEVITLDGKSKGVCGKAFNKPKIQKVKVSPNILNRDQTCIIEMIGFKESELKGSTLYIYNTQGIEVYKNDQVEDYNQLNINFIQGIYYGRLKTSNGQFHNFEIVVSN